MLSTNKYDLRYIEQMQKLQHDMKKNILALKILLKNHEYSRLDAYLDELLEETIHILPSRYCKHTVINGILCHQISSADAMGITVSCKIMMPESISISDKDITKLLMNLLENAIYACQKVTHSPLLEFYMHYDTPYLFILCKNTAIPNKHKKRKGFGHLIINSIVKKYDGFANYTFSSGIFTAEIALKCVNYV